MLFSPKRRVRMPHFTAARAFLSTSRAFIYTEAHTRRGGSAGKTGKTTARAAQKAYVSRPCHGTRGEVVADFSRNAAPELHREQARAAGVRIKFVIL